MSLAWTCVVAPEQHGSFLQTGLDNLTAIYGALQPFDRYACPVCLADGKPGYARPASHTEAARLAAQQGAT